MAAPPVDVKIRGIKQLDQGARRLFDNIETAVPRDAVHPTAEQVAATVRSRVPVRSGALRASVIAVRVGRVSQVRLGAGLPYGKWIEFGAWGGRKGPRGGRYVYPTAKRTARAFAKHAEQVTSQQIARMHWPTPR